MNTDVFYDAQKTEDMLDDAGNIAQSFDTMITRADERRKQDMMNRMHNPQPTTPDPQSYAAPVQPVAQAALQPQQVFPAQQPASPAQPDPSVTFNPYPTEIHQMMINPLDQADQLAIDTPIAAPVAPQKETPPSTSEKQLSPDIINLASNSDLSIETIQREADRISKKESDSDGEEVVISLR